MNRSNDTHARVGGPLGPRLAWVEISSRASCKRVHVGCAEAVGEDAAPARGGWRSRLSRPAAMCQTLDPPPPALGDRAAQRRRKRKMADEAGGPGGRARLASSKRDRSQASCLGRKGGEAGRKATFFVLPPPTPFPHLKPRGPQREKSEGLSGLDVFRMPHRPFAFRPGRKNQQFGCRDATK